MSVHKLTDRRGVMESMAGILLSLRNRPLSPTNLSHHSNLNYTTFKRLVQQLVELGLIVRLPNRRQTRYVVSLTRKGLEVLEEYGSLRNQFGEVPLEVKQPVSDMETVFKRYEPLPPTDFDLGE